MTPTLLASPEAATYMPASIDSTVDTTKQISEVGGIVHDANIGSHPVQPTLPHVMFQGLRPKLPRRRKYPELVRHEEDSLEASFRVRVQHRYSPVTASQYLWVLHDLVRLATRLSGRKLSAVELLRNPDLLGRTLASGGRGRSEGQVSAWLASQRRSVIRSFARLMASELAANGIPNGEERITRALRCVSEPVGTGFRLPVGWPRGRGGPMPTNQEEHSLLKSMGSAPGWIGERNVAILLILARRGQRIGALLRLDGRDFHCLPNGKIRMVIRAKSSRVPAEITVPDDAKSYLERYAHEFNRWAALQGKPQRIGYGVCGPFWRANTGNHWTYDNWRRELRIACQQANTSHLTAHSFRRAFATNAVTAVSRSLAASAGNWTSPRRMDDHYVQPLNSRLQSLLGALQPHTVSSLENHDQGTTHSRAAPAII